MPAAIPSWAMTSMSTASSWWRIAREAPPRGTIFELYLKHQALIPVVDELERRGWRNKQWTTRNGTARGGTPFTKATLHYLSSVKSNASSAFLCLGAGSGYLAIRPGRPCRGSERPDLAAPQLSIGKNLRNSCPNCLDVGADLR